MMEDKKALLTGAVILVFLGATAAGVYHVLIGSKGQQEFTAVESSRDIGFPSTSPQTASAPSRQTAGRIAPPKDWDQTPSSAEQSSLGFIKGKAQGAGGPAISEPAPSAAEAATAGDVEGLLREIKEEGGAVPSAGGEALTSKAIRNIMQQVVDGVHSLQPTWYEEFLGNKYLKRIADRYDKSNDFPRFLKDIGTSKSFYHMVKAHYKSRSMKELTQEMFRDKGLKKDLFRIFFEEKAVKHVFPLIARFGSSAGLPSTFVKTAKAETSKIKSQPEKRLIKRRTRPRSKKLKKMSLDGGYGSADSGDSKNSGATPDTIPDKYKKYLKP